MASHPRTAPLRAVVRENADVESSSDHYAARFRGAVGQWFLEVQTRNTLETLAGLPPGAKVLDVGGGHAQVAPPLIAAGYKVTVVGSDASCGARLHEWTSTGRCTFDVADLQHLPYADRSFDAVVCYRLVAHSVNWQRLIGELCRVAADRVIVDYPARRSVSLYGREEVSRAFAAAGFEVSDERPQFLLPMVLYRLVRSALFARAAEWPAGRLGLTRVLGSPVIVRADRRR